MAEKSDINAVSARVYRDGKKSLRYIQVYTGIYRARVKRGGLHFISPPRHALKKTTRRNERKEQTYPLCSLGVYKNAQNLSGAVEKIFYRET